MKPSASLYITLFFLVISVPLYGQYTLSGVVYNSCQEPLDYAFVSLLHKPDSSALQIVPVDSTGTFLLESKQPFEAQVLKISALGYEEVAIDLDTPGSRSFQPYILRQLPDSLGDVTISRRKPLLERKPDRMIFNVAQSIAALGSNALDIIQKTPGVLYRQQDNSFNIIGKSTVQVLINSRLVQLAGDDLVAYLQSIPAANIDRIEIITAPPANYDAAGNSGLINIVLRKSRKNGLNSSIRLAYEQAYYGKGTAGVDINYRIDKISLYGNVNYSNGANNIIERLNTPYLTQLYKVNDHYKRILKPLQYNMDVGYELHANGVLGIEWSGNIFNRTNEARTGIEVYALQNSLLDSAMLTDGLSAVKSINNVLNVNYAWDIDSIGRKLSLNINRLWFDGEKNNDFKTIAFSDAFITPNGTGIANSSFGRQDIDIITAQADLDMPFKWAEFSLGGKLGFIDNRSNNRFGAYQNGNYIEDTTVSNAFDYTERVQALYLKVEKNISKWSFQAGLRGEFTRTTGHSIRLSQVNNNRYFNIFPTLYIQYQLAEQHGFNFNYSKRINRPDYRSLDPFRAYATPYHYNEGNPFLLPSFSHNIELAYTFKSNYFCSLFYQYTHNYFGSVWFADAVRKVTSGISMNFADFISYGINLSASLHPVKWLQLQPQLSIMKQQLQSRVYSIDNRVYHRASWYAGINGSVMLNNEETFLAEVNLFYISRYREDFLEINPLGSVDLGIKYLLMDKKLVIGLSGSDLFVTQKARGVHVVSGQTINNYFDVRNVKLSLNYRLGSNTLKRRGSGEKGIEEEQKRAG